MGNVFLAVNVLKVDKTNEMIANGREGWMKKDLIQSESRKEFFVKD